MKKAAAKKTAARKAPATAKKTTAKKTTAKKATARKTTAKKATARKAPARKKLTARKKAALAPAAPTLVPPENPRAHALARKVAQLLSDKKALDIVILDVRGMTSYADYFVVASGESDRQVSAMAEHVLVKVKTEDGVRAIGTEGTETGQWVLLDFGEVVAHLFLAEMRAHYDLEGLWADARREKVA